MRSQLPYKTKLQSQIRSGNLAAASVIVVAASLFAAFVGIIYGQVIIDKVTASNFSAPPEIRSITSSLKLTEGAKTIFLASRPKVETGDTFNNNCQSTERTTAMLGCYYQRKIYLYNVTNPELRGAVEVTAAHELLHGAHDRLPFYERDKIDKLVDAEYQKVKDDKTISSLVAYYKRAEPGAVTNELHSIIGTTVRDLSPELEQYYSRYFNDRLAIVSMNEAYSAVFDRVQKEADELSVKINSERPAIEADLKSYESDQSQLKIDIDVFNERASSGGFASQSSFWVARSSLVSRSGEMSARRDEINKRVEAFNTMISRLNQLSVRSSELNKSINGISAPEASL